MNEIQELMAQLNALKVENANLRAEDAADGIRVSEKGAVSVYGLGRFPVTLYKEQWLKLNARMADVLAFIKANDTILKAKAPKAAKAPEVPAAAA